MAEQKTTKRKTSPATKKVKATEQKQTGSRNGDNKFQDKVVHLSNKIAQSVKVGAQKVFHFTDNATKLSRLKVEVHNLKNQSQQIQLAMGKQLWQMHRDKKLNTLQGKFDEEFKKLESLQNQIATKQNEAESISLME